LSKKVSTNLITEEEEEEKIQNQYQEEKKGQDSTENSKEQDFKPTIEKPLLEKREKLSHNMKIIKEDPYSVSEERTRKSSPSEMLKDAVSICISLGGSIKS
jgi:hypothetical protein